jgi:hypothetical protein
VEPISIYNAPEPTFYAAYLKTIPRGARKVSWRADLVNDLARGLADASPVALVRRAGGGLYRARLALQGS